MARIRHQLKGRVFFYLTVEREAGIASNKSILWRCKCKCGQYKNIEASKLVHGRIKSCGCLRKKNLERMKRWRLSWK